MRFSAFTPFGHLAFSGRQPHGERIYRDMVRQLGGEKNYSTDFDSPAMARVYANAMTFASARYTLERAGSQFRPNKLLELLPVAERELGLAPDPGDTLAERRRSVAAEMIIARGARRSNVESVLRSALGEHFIAYITTSVVEAAQSTNAPENVGVYAAPGMQRSVFRTTSPVMVVGEPTTVYYEEVTGARASLLVGDRIIVDPGNPGRVEAVTVAGIGPVTKSPKGRYSGSFTATFEHPHDRGVVLATGRHPNHASTKRHSLIVLSDEAIRSQRLRRKAHRAASRLFRGVSTWSLTCEAPGAPAVTYVDSAQLIGTGTAPPTVTLSGDYAHLTGLRVRVVSWTFPILSVEISLDGGDTWGVQLTAHELTIAPWTVEIPGAPGAFLTFPRDVGYNEDNFYEVSVTTVPAIPAEGKTGPFRVGVGRIGITTIGAVEIPS